MTHADALQIIGLLNDLRDGLWWVIFLAITAMVLK